MKLSVYVLGQEVAVLEPVGDFKSVLTYLPDTVPDNFVSFTIPVRTQFWIWNDPLHPVSHHGVTGSLRWPWVKL